jgi:hypothetical protein
MTKESLAPNDKLKVYCLLIAGLIATWGMFVMGWCTIQKIYIDVPMLLVLSNIVTGIASSITTLLVGRTIAQLNQQSAVTNKPLVDNTENPNPKLES